MDVNNKKKCRAPVLHRNIKTQSPKKMRKDGGLETIHNTLHISARSRAYTGTTTTRKEINLIKQVPKSEEKGNEGRFKTTNNTSHSAGSRAYTGTTTTRKVIKLIKRAQNPKKMGTKEGLKQPTTSCLVQEAGLTPEQQPQEKK
jgi:hypothetical protein